MAWMFFRVFIFVSSFMVSSICWRAANDCPVPCRRKRSRAQEEEAGSDAAAPPSAMIHKAVLAECKERENLTCVIAQ